VPLLTGNSYTITYQHLLRQRKQLFLMKITMMADFSDKIDRRIEKCDAAGEYGGNRKNHVWAGLFVLCIGAVLLLKQTGVQFPFWLFTWPVLIISLGILNGIKQDFRPGPWMLL
jgi:hypothetical protein